MKDLLDGVLDQLVAVEGVLGASIIDAQAGLIISSIGELPGDPKGVAALGADLYSRLIRGVNAASFGRAGLVQLEGRGGTFIIAPSGDLLVVVVCEAGADLRRVRLEALESAEGLR